MKRSICFSSRWSFTIDCLLEFSNVLSFDLVADSMALSFAWNVDSEATVVPCVDAVLLSSSSLASYCTGRDAADILRFFVAVMFFIFGCGGWVIFGALLHAW